jgi:hypothetical protein
VSDLPEKIGHPTTVARGHEQSDVKVRPLAIFLAALTASLVIVVLAVAWLFDLFLAEMQRADPAAPPHAEGDVAPRGPLLQVSPRRELARFRETEEKRLSTTEWVDTEQGIVRITIDLAMKLAAERGLPVWPKVDAAAGLPLEEPPNEGGEQP